MKHLDAQGTTLHVGDRVAWASRQSSSAWLTFGEVIELGTSRYGTPEAAVKSERNRTVRHHPATFVVVGGRP